MAVAEYDRELAMNESVEGELEGEWVCPWAEVKIPNPLKPKHFFIFLV